MSSSVVAQSLHGTDHKRWQESMDQLLRPVLEQLLAGTGHISYHDRERRMYVTWKDGPRREAVEASVQAVLGALPLRSTPALERVLEYGEAGVVVLRRRRSHLQVAAAIVELYRAQGCVCCGGDSRDQRSLAELLARSDEQVTSVAEHEEDERIGRLLLQVGKLPGDGMHAIEVLEHRLCRLGHLEGIKAFERSVSSIGGRTKQRRLTRQQVGMPPQERLP